MMMYNKNSGFTLLEVLLAITLMTILLTFTFFTFQKFSHILQKELFLTQLEADLYYAHAYAINHGESVIVRFKRLNNEYEAINNVTREIIFLRKLPTSIIIDRTNLDYFVITPRGTVSRFGTVYFRINDEEIKVTFQIGRGRFKIE